MNNSTNTITKTIDDLYEDYCDQLQADLCSFLPDPDDTWNEPFSSSDEDTNNTITIYPEEKLIAERIAELNACKPTVEQWEDNGFEQ